MHDEMATAIVREKQLKKWNRGWKIELIEKMNPLWHDLYESLNR
jgi:putative endonuclease